MSDTSVASSVVSEVHALLQRLGVPASAYQGGDLAVRSPLTGEVVAHVPQRQEAKRRRDLRQADIVQALLDDGLLMPQASRAP